MKQQKLSAYKPNYPRKAFKGATLAAAALLALGTTAGCGTLKKLHVNSQNATPIPEPTPGEELVLDGEIQVYDGPDVLGYISTMPPETEEPWERTEGMVPIESTPEPETDVPLTTGVPLLTPDPDGWN
jgi:hypothetical protein